MPSKKYTKTGRICRVTFRLPPEVGAKTAVLVGDFNDWDGDEHPMKRLKDGGFSVTASLPTGKSYRYRFLLDGARWENDWAADAYVPNGLGGEDSIVEV